MTSLTQDSRLSVQHTTCQLAFKEAEGLMHHLCTPDRSLYSGLRFGSGPVHRCRQPRGSSVPDSTWDAWQACLW